MAFLKFRGIWVFISLLVVSGALLGRSPFSRVDETNWHPVEVRHGDIDVKVLSTGYVLPQNRLEIKPPTAGRLEKILVPEGAKVTRGQIIAYMSSTERAALLDAARGRGPEELKKWEDLLRPTPIIAPLTGTIINRNCEPGQTWRAEDVMMVVANRLTVKAQVDETDIAQIELGQSAKITLDAYGDQPIPAKVTHIAYDAKNYNNVTSYDVEALPAHIPPFMRSGMTANVTFEIAVKRNVLMLPFSAVGQKEGKTTVTVQDPDNFELKAVPIEVGVNDGKNIEVVSGLKAGQTVMEPVLRLPGKKTASGFSFSFGGGSGRK